MERKFPGSMALLSKVRCLSALQRWKLRATSRFTLLKVTSFLATSKEMGNTFLNLHRVRLWRKFILITRLVEELALWISGLC